MDLKEFNSPLPKPWLNIQAGSVVSAIEASTPPVTNITVFPATLTAAQVAGPAITFSSAAAYAVALPTGAQLSAYVNGILGANAPAAYSFSTVATSTGGGTGTFTPGAGLSLWNGAGTFGLPSSNNRVWVFTLLGGAWTMIF